MGFRFRRLELDGLVLIEPDVFPDERGWFSEFYKDPEFLKQGIGPMVQANLSFSHKGVLRGLHYQLPPAGQGKLVRCLSGSILDVAVDIRKHSSSCGKWISYELSAENHRMLYLPPGFAHGFCVTTEKALVAYEVTAPFAPELDRGIRWNDPDLAIDWPVNNPVLSNKDAQLPLLKDAEVFP